jgi:small subunit ribosomal protein S4
MPVIRGPKHKLSRREGVDLFGTGGESLRRRLDSLPGQHGRKPQRTESEYARQLREKQKVKRMYGMREAQFRRFFNMASQSKGVTGQALLILLERRLDNVVYRLGFTRTRLQSRQLVNHGHVMVDGQRVTIPSFLVKPGMEITLAAVGRRIPSVQDMIESNPPVMPWLERTGPGEGRVLRDPDRSEIDAHINERAIVEFYSR